MRKHVIGILAAALSASSAFAATQSGLQNFDTRAVSSPVTLHSASKSVAAIRAKTRSGTVAVTRSALPTLAGYPSHFDAKMQAPTFLWANPSQKRAAITPIKGEKVAESMARSYLYEQAATLKLGKDSIDGAKLTNLHDVGKGPIIARFQQMSGGLEVFGRQMNVMMGRDMRPVATSGYFATQDKTASSTSSKRGAAGSTSFASTDAFRLDAEHSVALAFADFSGQQVPATGFKTTGTAGDYTILRSVKVTGDILANGDQRAKRVYFPVERKLVPAWYVEVSGQHLDGADSYDYGYVVSAVDGKILFRKNQIDYDYSYRTYADASGIFQPFDSPLGNGYDPYVGVAPNGNLPRTPATTNLVTLNNGPISTNDPWLPAGATTTIGNNVNAYLDLSGTPDGSSNPPGDGFQPNTADFRPNATGSTFDFPYAPDTDPSTTSQRSFAVVNLFYLNNWLHDWWYDNGFDEASGNAQTDNFNRGGLGGDALLAEGQDFSGRNNANESTRADGGRVRQQMYLFDGPVNGELTVTAPAGIGSLPFNTASFGAQIFDVTGTVVASAPQNGCSAFTNAAAIAGNIALIDRGTCGFVVKVKNAQNAGATAVIIANNAAGGAPGLGGTDATITIGTLSVSQADGATIRANLPVTARVRRSASIDRDGTVDEQIIAHEWFHTTSNRLVGNASGLSNQQGGGMGEGWSDFSALLLTVRPEDRNVAGNDQYQGAYPEAFYSVGDAYFGIRRAPYSTSFATFPLTFRHISNGVPLPTTAPVAFGQNGASNSEVHNTGEIWCNTLWEIYAALLNDPRYSFTQAQNRMKDYVIAGLKMTPNAPTMLEARDALLAAARATDPQDFNLMATAFAKRGMGVGAVAPDRDSATNANAVEEFTALAGRFTVTNAALDFGYVNGNVGYIDNDGILDPNETALLSVTIVSNGTQSITSPVIATLSSTGDITFGNGGQIVFPASSAAPIAYGTSVTGTITVRLNSATQTAQPVTLSIAYPDVGPTPTSVFEPAGQSIDLLVNADVVPNARSSDDIEQLLTAYRDWTPVLNGDAGSNWQVADGNDPALAFNTGLLWYVPDNGAPTDVTLTTPELTVSPTVPFSFSFEHYFQFEFDSVINSTNFGYDGGVIEISSDGGATWVDIVDAGGTFTAGNGYNGVVEAFGDPARSGFVDNNFAANGGLLEPVTVSFGTAFAGRTVRLRFREMSDANTGDFGWAVDNVSFGGITNRPFSQTVAEDNNHPPVANAGRDLSITTGVVTRLPGSATDDAGTQGLSYAWTQTAGPTVALTGANTATPSFTPPSDGLYTFLLTVTDAGGLSGTDSVNLLSSTPAVAPPAPTTPPGGGSFGFVMFGPGLLALWLRRRNKRA